MISPNNKKQIAIDLESLCNQFNDAVNRNDQQKAYDLQTTIKAKLTADDKESTAMRKLLTIKKPSTKPTPNPTPTPTPIPSPTPTPQPTPTPTPNPSGNSKVFLRIDTPLTEYLKSHSDEQLQVVDGRPTFTWLNGTETETQIVARVTDILNKGTAQNAIPGFSLYAIPGRDAGNFSAGGVKDAARYKAYVGAIGYAIQQSGNPECVFVVETDALGLNLPLAYECINAAVDILKKNSNTKVFLTASEWVEASDMAGRLKGAGVERADGIASNIAGRSVFPDIEIYTKNILTHLKPGLKYIIDTSRNGAKVADGQWCNTPGTKLGVPPQIFDEAQRYAYAWVKPPAESDGNCNGGPGAGQLWVEGLRKMI